MAEVHMAVTRKVKPGFEADFDVRLQEFAIASMHCEGMAGVHILRPPLESGSQEFGILRSFETEADAQGFYGSELFADWNQQIAGLVEGDPIRRRLSGLEAFFRNERGPMPPRWKMALVTFLGVFPSVLIWSRLVPALMGELPSLLAAVIVNALVVATLTWLVMPVLTKAFHRWLHHGLA